MSKAAEFYKALEKFRKQFPMCHIEAWTPDDFRTMSRKSPSLWGNVYHLETVANLERNFDAEQGTNWDRIALAAYHE